MLITVIRRIRKLSFSSGRSRRRLRDQRRMAWCGGAKSIGARLFMPNTHRVNDNMWPAWPSESTRGLFTGVLSSANPQRKAHPGHHIVSCSFLALWIRDENAVDETFCSIGEIASTIKHHVRFGTGNRKKIGWLFFGTGAATEVWSGCVARTTAGCHVRRSAPRTS